jgi:anaerobic selenocysteine-containing dehydrogenase
MASLGIGSGDRIEITSDSGRITAVAAADETVRSGVLFLSHAWGVLPDDASDEMGGVEMACVSLLIDSSRDVEAINAMPRMSGIPVNIQRLDRAANV